jgi:hypothetical protein
LSNHFARLGMYFHTTNAIRPSRFTGDGKDGQPRHQRVKIGQYWVYFSYISKWRVKAEDWFLDAGRIPEQSHRASRTYCPVNPSLVAQRLPRH